MQADDFGQTLSYVLQELRKEHETNKKISLKKPKISHRHTSTMAERLQDSTMKTYAVTPVKKYKRLSPLPRHKTQIAAYDSITSKKTNDQSKTMISSLNYTPGPF